MCVDASSVVIVWKWDLIHFFPNYFLKIHHEDFFFDSEELNVQA